MNCLTLGSVTGRRCPRLNGCRINSTVVATRLCIQNTAPRMVRAIRNKYLVVTNHSCKITSTNRAVVGVLHALEEWASDGTSTQSQSVALREYSARQRVCAEQIKERGDMTQPNQTDGLNMLASPELTRHPQPTYEALRASAPSST